MKRILSLLLVLMMVLAFVPCVALAGSGDTSQFVALNLMCPGNPPDDMTYLNKVQDTWNAYLKEKLNCSVNIQFLTWNDWETNYNLKLMAGEGLDSVDAGTWLDLWTNCSAGAYYDLTDLLPTYAPDVYAKADPSAWKTMQYEGKNLYIPQMWYTQWTDQGFAYRADWAEQVGITEPITTFAQLNDYLLKVQKAAGTGTIPAGINAFYTHNNRAENWYAYVTAFTNDRYLDLSTGFTFILAYDMDNGKVYSPVFDDGVMNGFAGMMKGWYDSGVYNTDVLNCTDDVQAKFVQGLTACYGTHTQSYTKGFTNAFYKQWADDPATEAVEGDPNAKVAFFSPCDQSNNLTTINPANDCLAISAASKNPERALQFINLYYTDEYLYRLMNYGIEGETYTITEDGNYQAIDSTQWPAGEDRTFFTNLWGCRFDDFIIPDSSWDKDIASINAHKASIAKPYPLPAFSFNSTNVSAQYAAVCDVVSAYMPRITYGEVASVEDTVAEFRAALKTAGIDALISEVQAQVDASLQK